ncbi:MAG TPA: hypothetical protein VEW08_13210, partial [Steroidobacteraceae bacterium]|nr:hypothetical protein [Steroidobacteraceae bacterium]
MSGARKIIWFPLLTAFLLSACEQRAATPTSADARKPLADEAAPAIPDQPVQGTVLGNAFSADQIILKESRIRFRQGNKFFADREVAIDIPALPRVPVIRSGTIWLSE